MVDLVKPIQKKYNLPLTVAMGKNMDAVICDDESTAIEAINYLKQQRLGKFTFLPLETIRTVTVNEANRRLGHRVKLAMDVVEYDQSIHRALLYSLGNTLVAEDMGTARRLCYGANSSGHKCVTLNGTLIHKNGNITGGNLPRGMADKARRWDEKEVSKSRTRRDALMKELSQLEVRARSQKSEATMLLDIQDKKARLQMLRSKAGTWQKTITKCEEAIKLYTARIEEKEALEMKLRKEVSESSAALKKFEVRVHSVEDGIFEAFARKVGVSSIREYEATRLKSAQKHAKRKAELATQEERLRNQLEFERSKDMSKPMKALEESRTRLRKDLKSMQQRKESEGLAIEAAQSELDQHNAELQVKLDELEQSKQALSVVRKAARKFQREIQKIENDISSIEGMVEKLKDVRGQLSRQAQVEQVDLPTVWKGGKRKRGQAAGARKRRRTEDGSQSAEDDDSKRDSLDRQDVTELIEYDFEMFADEEPIDSLQEYERQKNELRQRIDSVAAHLSKLAPNLKAIERFTDIKVRLATVTRQFTDAKQKVEDARDEFRKIEQERVELFMHAFKHVEGQISNIYRDLTKSASFPMGGTAYLHLENQTEPFTAGVKYHAMPPMKRFRDMEQLSGGEKSVASLALLFAIHSFKPSPFFVLDEVDAALDASNVNKVANYVRMRSREDKLQIIVISLKDQFYEKADALVGVYKDRKEESSGILTADLRKYEQAE